MQRADPTGYPYFRYLEECNEFGAGDVQAWLFYPGMLFGSLDKWWPDTGSRPTAHEGLDICYFTDGLGRDLQFDSSTNVPVMAAGTVIAVCDDFLGRSVFVEYHPDRLISVYAHIIPKKTLRPGDKLSEGEVIGRVADTTGRKNRMPAHLHITIMKIPVGLPGEQLNWNFICRSGRVTLFDPLTVLVSPSCRILPGIVSQHS
jgi:murein DD-endopeptidase MepM/ murein hydrolase activator NlpD